MQEQGRLAAEQLMEQQCPAFAAVLEQQMQEVKQILTQIQTSYLKAASQAFNGAFMLSSYLMLLGIPFALFSDHRRTRKMDKGRINLKTES